MSATQGAADSPTPHEGLCPAPGHPERPPATTAPRAAVAVATPGHPCGPHGAQSSSAPRFLDRVRIAIRTRHYSARTEEAYVGWIRRFILFNGKRHPDLMGEPEITAFLSNLATQGRVSASTQNQALAAILFLYQRVLGCELEYLSGVVHAKRPERLPVVLSRDEATAVLARMEGVPALMASLLYGSGLRVLECAALRVKDIDFDRHELTARDGKGRKDRVTLLPARLEPAFRTHLARVHGQYARDRPAAWVPWPCPTPSTESTRQPRGSGPGSGSSPRAATTLTG